MVICKHLSLERLVERTLCILDAYSLHTLYCSKWKPFGDLCLDEIAVHQPSSVMRALDKINGQSERLTGGNETECENQNGSWMIKDNLKTKKRLNTTKQEERKRRKKSLYFCMDTMLLCVCVKTDLVIHTCEHVCASSSMYVSNLNTNLLLVIFIFRLFSFFFQTKRLCS